MSEAFISEENKKRGIETTLQLNLRLFKSLPLFRKLMGVSFIFIVLSSAGPSLVRWYSGNYAASESGFSMSTLVLLVFCGIFCRIAAWISFEISGMWSAQDLHRDMVRGLSRTRTTYFDENPSSRLINRLIRDFDEVRSTAIIFVGDLFNAVIEILSIAVVGAFASPFVLVLIFPLLFAFFYVQYYRSSMLSHARRLSAVTTGQVLARQTDLIEGREIFLLYGKSKVLLNRMAKSFKTYAQASLTMTNIDAWGTFWIRMTAEAFSFFVLIFLIFALRQNRVDAALAGVIISSLFGITGSIGWLDFSTSLIARSIPHLERVFEIIDLPREENEEQRVRTNPAFIGHRDLTFKNYTMSYRKDSPIVIEKLDLQIKRGLKTALVGRTGSGKSSIIQAIFRMVYVHAGDVFLDGESIFATPANAYRKRFAMIPQSPYLFAGTIRSNLDPGFAVSDEKLSLALAKVGLNYRITHEISEEGKNLSQGERQLICLARAMVSNKDFLILDEATSGLDPETDARIIQVLKREFHGKTVITIAHRLDTIRDYDWVIELAEGKVVREGKPELFLNSF